MTTTLEENLARLAQIEAEMIEFAAGELEALEPGEGARIVGEVVARHRQELTRQHRGGEAVYDGEVPLRWWDS